MKEPILLIMAAGMGSRYGGLKQMDPIGPSGEVILDYSIFDAKRAGFKRVIFLIKHEIEKDFKEIVGKHIEKHMEVMYAYQQIQNIPAGFKVPDGRVKPWGTGHAVLCCKHLIDAPFAVINADDYYGVSAFRTAYQYLTSVNEETDEYMMVGYHLDNTLTQNGHVARGVCTIDSQGILLDITERTHIIGTVDGAMYTENGIDYHLLPADTLVSMNMWCFTPSLLNELEKRFPEFLSDAVITNPTKGEFFLPSVVNRMLKNGEAVAIVKESTDRWHGVTYAEDKPMVKEALSNMTKAGVYPNPLWD